MVMPLRVEYEGALYHVTSRGNARVRIFWEDDDRVIFPGGAGWSMGRRVVVPGSYITKEITSGE